MFELILRFLRRHTTISNGAVLAIYGCVVLYRMAFTLFTFSIIRFLKEALGEDFLIIGILMASANVLMILIDLPLGALQKYIKPRYFFLFATFSLFLSALVFLLASELSLWWAALAMLFFQLSIEVYYVVISTAILRLSDEKTYAQNMSQQSIFDNTGKVFGLAAGGALFFIDRLVSANNFVVAFAIAFLALAVTLYVYFIIDVDHYNRIERSILDLKPLQKVRGVLQTISQEMLGEDPKFQDSKIPKSQGDEIIFQKPVFAFGTFVQEIRDSAMKMVDLAKNVRVAPVLAWGLIMVAGSNWWYNSIATFESVFVKEIFKKDTGWIAENVPRYFFESLMLIAAIIIPTLFALPLGKLADKWGKWKMVTAGTMISGLSIFSLLFFQSAGQVFIVYLIMVFGFVTITPALTGMLGQEFKQLNKRLAVSGQRLENTNETPEVQDDNSEGESAGVVSIAINVGEILGGLFGGAMLQLVGFTGTFVFFGPLLLLAGGASIFFFQVFLKKPETGE